MLGCVAGGVVCMKNRSGIYRMVPERREALWSACAQRRFLDIPDLPEGVPESGAARTHSKSASRRDRRGCQNESGGACMAANESTPQDDGGCAVDWSWLDGQEIESA